jgi:hypothetical protein
VAAGYDFVLPTDDPESTVAQANWRFCGQCYAMFFNGYPSKGVCAGGAGRQGQGLNFLLPHDVPSTPTAQSGWRFCEKCSVAFFDGYADKRHCRAGGGHVAAGYTFVLPHAPQMPIPGAPQRIDGDA